MVYILSYCQPAQYVLKCVAVWFVYLLDTWNIISEKYLDLFYIECADTLSRFLYFTGDPIIIFWAVL